MASKCLTPAIFFLVYLTNWSNLCAQDILLTSKGAATINKAVVLSKIDDVWGSKRWYGEFMYNNSTFKVKHELSAGPHTLAIRPGKGAPVTVAFVAEAQKSYEIVEDDKVIKIYCPNDDAFVATAKPALYKEIENATTSSFVQNLNMRLDKSKTGIRIHTMDGLFGTERSHYGGYFFPGENGVVSLGLDPGKHTLEFTLTTGSYYSIPITLDFEVEENKTYELKLELHDKEGSGFFKLGKKYFTAAVVSSDG